MSQSVTIYIGPCAEWLVRRSQTPIELDDIPVVKELWEAAVFRLDMHGYSIPLMEVGGVEYARFTFLPADERKGSPTRSMGYADFYPDGPLVAIDLLGVDRDAEVRWFASAFEPELRRLGMHFGSEPRLCWSLVANANK